MPLRTGFRPGSSRIGPVDFPPDSQPGCCCDLAKKADEVLPQYLVCPHCHGALDALEGWGWKDAEKVLLETNGSEEQDVVRVPIGTCSGCGGDVALLPIPVIYNANHDVHYTGGNLYLAVRTDSEALMTDVAARCRPLIEDWLARQETDKPVPQSLVTWLSYACEHAVAAFQMAKDPTKKKRPREPGQVTAADWLDRLP